MLAPNIPLLNLHVAAISLTTSGWLHITILQGCYGTTGVLLETEIGHRVVRP